MRNIIRNQFTALLLFLIWSSTNAQNDSNKSVNVARDSNVNINISLSDFISEDEGDQEKADSSLELLNNIDNLVKWNKPWKVKNGDDPIWSQINFDDSNWQVLSTDSAEKIQSKYEGIGWYRIHFEIDSSLMNVPLAFYIRQFGTAADVYLNGKFLNSYGKVGNNKKSEEAEFSLNPKPFAFSFSNTKNHVFAIRLSTFHRANIISRGISLGKNFKISVKNLNEEISYAADPSKYFPLIFFSAIFLTLGAVHFIMFIYNRQKKSNLSYSMYCFGIFAFGYYAYYILTTSDFATIALFSKSIMYFLPLIIVPLVSMLHRIFYGKRLKIFWIIVVLNMVSITMFISSKLQIAAVIVFVLFLMASVEIIRVIFNAIRKRKDGAWIFAFVILLAPLAGIISSNLPDYFVISGIKIPNNTGAIVASCFILGLPFSMTLYLARDFANMGKQLKKQIKQITDLSETTLQQEKEKKQILENQKSELEIKVVERTQEVWEQKNVIEIKNKEITDSLVYAKRIQIAMLPDRKLLSKMLEQSFILFLPKDIVSGDFYAFSQRQNKILVGAADCTGHGVAGAFMSLIGGSLLYQIVNEKNVTEPALILDHLNEGIIRSLKQKENNSNDGMDIAVCAFDLEQNELKFAGANRPLWLIRNNELHFFKPDKYPIGGLQVMHDERFTQHVIQLQKGDTIYMFSDGYADQFGGDSGKKLMTKRFREQLLSIQNKSMHEQEEYLNNYFEDWKGAYEQVDDVLVIGIRI